jgi:hypothetical protein
MCLEHSDQLSKVEGSPYLDVDLNSGQSKNSGQLNFQTQMNNLSLDFNQTLNDIRNTTQEVNRLENERKNNQLNEAVNMAQTASAPEYSTSPARRDQIGDIDITEIGNQIDRDLSLLSHMSLSEQIALANAGLEGSAYGLKEGNGTFRLTNGRYWGNRISLKYYSSGWAGGSVASITTYSSYNLGRAVGFGAGTITIGLVGYDLYNSYNMDGGRLGYYSGRSVVRSGAGIGLATVGGYLFAAACAPSGLGAIPAYAIGSALFGWLGSGLGESAYDASIGPPPPPLPNE